MRATLIPHHSPAGHGSRGVFVSKASAQSGWNRGEERGAAATAASSNGRMPQRPEQIGMWVVRSRGESVFSLSDPGLESLAGLAE